LVFFDNLYQPQPAPASLLHLQSSRSERQSQLSSQVKQLISEDTRRVSVASFIESHINRFNQSIVSLFHWNLNMQVRLCIFKC
jgi:hypothetical protein